MSPARQVPNKPELGPVRLYPVARTVVFPHTGEVLHVADPADLLLVEDALAGDRLVALAGVAPGWHNKAPGVAPVQPGGCLARIAAWSDGGPAGYNLLLWGVARVRILRQWRLRRGLYQAQVEVRGDYYPADDAQRAQLHERLRQVVAKITGVAGLGPKAHAPNEEGVPLGVVADMMAHSLELTPRQKAALLAECDVHRRAELLLRYLAALAEAPGCLEMRTRLSRDLRPN